MRIINSGSKRTKRAMRAVRKTRKTRATRKTEAPPVIPGNQRIAKPMPRPNSLGSSRNWQVLKRKLSIYSFERLKDKLAPARVNNVI